MERVIFIFMFTVVPFMLVYRLLILWILVPLKKAFMLRFF